jgi:hypothetical protein
LNPHHDEARTLRSRHAAMVRAMDRPASEPPDGNPAMVVVTIEEGTYPTSAGEYYACQQVTPGGAEAEGSTPTFATLAGTLYALNLGTAIPPEGTRLVVASIDGRWAFHFNG